MPGVFCYLLFLYFDFPFSFLTFSLTLSTLYKFWAEVGAIQKFLLFFHTFQCPFPGQKINLREQSLIHSLISASIMTADSLLNLYNQTNSLSQGYFIVLLAPQAISALLIWGGFDQPALSQPHCDGVHSDFFLPTSCSSPALHKKTMNNSTDSTLTITD